MNSPGKAKPKLLLVSTACLGLLAALLAWRDHRGQKSPGSSSANPAIPSTSAKTPRVEAMDDNARELAKLPPRLLKIARRLKEAGEEEERQRPPHENKHLSYQRRLAFERQLIGQLDTADIAALAVALNENYALAELIGERFSDALHFTWGARDGTGALAQVMKVAEANGYWRDEANAWKDPAREIAREDYTQIIHGLATADPAAAWQLFQEALRDPAMQYITNAQINFYDILQAFAAKDPSSAWSVVIARESPESMECALRGFLSALPAGQDWEKLATEWEKARAAMGWVPGLDERRQMVGPWALQDPEAAFAWLFTGVDPGELDTENPFESIMPGLERSDGVMSAKLDLLNDLYESMEYRVPEAIGLLERLASGGEAEVAVRFLYRHLEGGLSPANLDLLQVIPKIDAPELRNELFFSIVRNMDPKGDNPADPFGERLPCEDPEACLAAMRQVASQLDLSADLKAEVEAAFEGFAGSAAGQRAAAEEPGR